MLSTFQPTPDTEGNGYTVLVHNITAQRDYLNLSPEELRYKQVGNRIFANKPQFQAPQVHTFWNFPVFRQPEINNLRFIPQATGTAIRRPRFSYNWTCLK
ncbi:unnamed protein product [Blepharisma stoltei]|uniref:Uncharacterized protein n=1 Tax=Blepharisma stoltei TaxID=1481888 RepID=A0AAU9IL41_9CILI|nr:unnamed protein product [Blepharisma stoltei]